MGSVMLYTIDCPKCLILEKKLTAAGIDYAVNKNTEEMVAKGYLALPILEVDGKAMTFKEAVDWINGH